LLFKPRGADGRALQVKGNAGEDPRFSGRFHNPAAGYACSGAIAPLYQLIREKYAKNTSHCTLSPHTSGYTPIMVSNLVGRCDKTFDKRMWLMNEWLSEWGIKYLNLQPERCAYFVGGECVILTFRDVESLPLHSRS
jgi:hypothetical protein